MKWCSFWESSNFSLKYLNVIGGLNWGLELKHLKAHILCDKDIFYSIILSQLWQLIEFKFVQVAYSTEMLRLHEF